MVFYVVLMFRYFTVMSYCLELYERNNTYVYLIFISGNYVMAALRIILSIMIFIYHFTILTWLLRMFTNLFINNIGTQIKISTILKL